MPGKITSLFLLNTYAARIIEDFEVIRPLEDDNKYHLEIRQCPFKYEMFRRPSLVFKRDTSHVNTKDYSSDNHDYYVEVKVFML